jgi:hypothetical protein
MKIYLGISGSSIAQNIAEVYNCGWCLTPDNNRDPKGLSYFLDNGAFSAWVNNTLWNETKFKTLIKKYPNFDFIVAPDIVCGGEKSLIHSCRYVGEIPEPLYLAVQDGMNAKMVTTVIDQFDGLFIGGSTNRNIDISWKFQTARMWVDLAHLHGKKCHAGRVNTWEGYVHMHICGVDSVDGTYASRNQDDSHIKKYYDDISFQRRLIL